MTDLITLKAGFRITQEDMETEYMYQLLPECMEQLVKYISNTLIDNPLKTVECTGEFREDGRYHLKVQYQILKDKYNKDFKL